MEFVNIEGTLESTIQQLFVRDQMRELRSLVDDPENILFNCLNDKKSIGSGDITNTNKSQLAVGVIPDDMRLFQLTTCYDDDKINSIGIALVSPS